jgi:hypothetical protein
VSSEVPSGAGSTADLSGTAAGALVRQGEAARKDAHAQGDHEDEDGPDDEGQFDSDLHRATHSIHFAIPPASSMTFLVCA